VSQGKLIVITAPSGAGKTTIARHLLHVIPSLAFSVSATTRPIRAEESDGRDYFFMTEDEFKNRIAGNEFMEWEQVYHGLFYGTLKSEIERLWAEGRHVLFDVDVQGALNLKKQFPDNTLTIFIKPPSYDVLMHRLHSRATEPPEKIEERIRKAQDELKYESSFDVAIVNDDLQNALKEAELAAKSFLQS
jgi:guanylate kinase